MLIKRSSDIRPSEITSKDLYVNRRKFIMAVAGIGSATGLAAAGIAFPTAAQAGMKLQNVRKSPLSTTGEELTPLKDVTTYNNYYEFGTGKDDPSENAGQAATRPWTVADRRRGQEAQGYRHRRAAQAGAAGRAGIPHALRRGLVDGHSLGRLFVLAS